MDPEGVLAIDVVMGNPPGRARNDPAAAIASVTPMTRVFNRAVGCHVR